MFDNKAQNQGFKNIIFKDDLKISLKSIQGKNKQANLFDKINMNMKEKLGEEYEMLIEAIASQKQGETAAKRGVNSIKNIDAGINSISEDIQNIER